MHQRMVRKTRRLESTTAPEAGEDAFLAVQTVQQGRIRVAEGNVRAVVTVHANRKGCPATKRVNQLVLA